MARVAKALVAGILAATGALTTSGVDGKVTTAEWITSVGAGVVAGLAVWRVPNKPAAL